MRHDHIDPKRPTVIPNGIDTTATSSALSPGQARQNLGLPPDAIVLGCVGRLEPQKGHRLLLTVLATLRKSRGDCPHLVIVGDSSQRELIHAAILEDGRYGTLVPSNNVDALQSAIEALIDQPERRLSLGALGSTRVRDHFSAGAMVKRLEAVYSDDLAQGEESPKK
ncbi:MAG: glycosyltransferase [Burkholderiaceae bacterium]|nr:MAG: glycosyltransferase [Burkholderiaceae bacterium]